MNCKKCGAEIEEDTIFCPACGSYVELRKRDGAVPGNDSAERPAQDSEAGDTGEAAQEAKAEYAGESARDTSVLQGYTDAGAESQDGYIGDSQTGSGAGEGKNSQYQYFDWKAWKKQSKIPSWSLRRKMSTVI